MKSLFEYIASHPIAGIAIVLLLCLTVFAWVKAIQAGKKRNEEREKIIAGLEKEKKLRNDYRNLSLSIIDNEKDDYRIIQGVCAYVQMKIEKIPDINNAFNELNNAKKNVYCLGYLFEDSKVKLSEFFRANGEPLLTATKNAVNEVIKGEYADIFNYEFDMFDEDNEDVSLDNKIIDEYDNKFKTLLVLDGKYITKNVVLYIKNNIDEITF